MSKGKSFGTLNLTDRELDSMEKYPDYRAIIHMKKEPYYLQYIRKQKENKDKKD